MNISLQFPLLAGKKVSFHTLGCKVNLYESEALTAALEECGCISVPFVTEEGGEPADICVVNTCSVTNIADRKSRQMLRRARGFVKPETGIVAAAGCYAQITGKKLIEDGVADIVIGTNQKNLLPEMLEKLLAQREEASAAGTAGEDVCPGPMDIKNPIPYEEQFLTHIESHTRAFIKIQEGCNQFCSYCRIPFARGRIRSRDLENIVKEVTCLSDPGREAPVREIVLTGIHLSSYGADLGGETGLLDVIERINAIEGVKRIRIGSLEPRIVTEKFAGRLAACGKVCPHFHLSLQSGAEETLRRMNRHYTPEEYRKCCEILRRRFDNPAITTDVIAGFPGETEENFEESRTFCRDIGFYEMHVFPYSRRSQTAADRMDGHLTEQEKKRRAGILIADADSMSERYRRQMAENGRPYEVLFEETVTIQGTKYWTGYTREYIRVAVPCEKAGIICPGTIASATMTGETVPGTEIMLAFIP